MSLTRLCCFYFLLLQIQSVNKADTIYVVSSVCFLFIHLFFVFGWLHIYLFFAILSNATNQKLMPNHNKINKEKEFHMNNAAHCIHFVSNRTVFYVFRLRKLFTSSHSHIQIYRVRYRYCYVECKSIQFKHFNCNESHYNIHNMASVLLVCLFLVQYHFIHEFLVFVFTSHFIFPWYTRM